MVPGKREAWPGIVVDLLRIARKGLLRLEIIPDELVAGEEEHLALPHVASRVDPLWKDSRPVCQGNDSWVTRIHLLLAHIKASV